MRGIRRLIKASFAHRKGVGGLKTSEASSLSKREQGSPGSDDEGVRSTRESRLANVSESRQKQCKGVLRFCLCFYSFFVSIVKKQEATQSLGQGNDLSCTQDSRALPIRFCSSSARARLAFFCLCYVPLPFFASSRSSSSFISF